MEALSYSLNATVPVFVVILVGYILKNGFHLFSDQTVAQLNKFNFNVTLPALLFMDLGQSDFKSVWNTGYVLFCAASTVLCVGVILFLSLRLMKDKPLAGEFVQAAYRSSAAVLGVAFIQNIYGTSSAAPLMIIGAVPVYNVAAVLVLSLTAPQDAAQDRGAALKKSLIGIVTNPILIGIAAGILFSLSGLTLPPILHKSISNFSSMATPLCLVALGAGFESGKALKLARPTLICAFVKLIAQVAVFLPLAILLGFRQEMLIALLVMLGGPTTASCYIMARNMGHEGVLTSSTVVVTSLLAAVTLTGWLFVLRVTGLV